MLDSELIIIMGDTIKSAIDSSGFGSVNLVQKAQPTQEGVPTGPTVFFEKLFHLGYGWPMTKYVQDPATLSFTEVVTQLTETTIQISSLSRQDPTSSSVITASDLVNHINLFFAMPSQIAKLLSQGISILKVKEVRNPYFENDSHIFEAHPSFDLVFTHNATISVGIPGIINAIPDIHVVA